VVKQIIMALDLSKLKAAMDSRSTNDGGDTGGQELKLPEIAPEKKQAWNQYVDWLDTKGMKGSKQLDSKGLGNKMIEEYNKENPDSGLSVDDVRGVQETMFRTAEAARAFDKRRGGKESDKIMEGTSKFDGYAGSKTTSFKFPSATAVTKHNDQVTSVKGLGLTDSNLQATGVGGNTQVLSRGTVSQVGVLMGHDGKRVPKGAKIETNREGQRMYQNDDGDLVIIKD
jgi:hypothetical protein